MDEFSYSKAARDHEYYEDVVAFHGLASEVAEQGREHQLSRDDFDWQAGCVYEAYSTFLNAMNPNVDDPKKQRAWRNQYRHARLGKKFGEPPMSQDLISDAVYGYLRGPMRVPSFDRALLDALIAQETFAFIDRSAGRSAMLTQYGCYGALFAICAVVGTVLGISKVDWNNAMVVIAVVAAIAFVLWWFPKRGPFALFSAMRDTYEIMTASVISVAELRRRVEASRDKGVVWPAEIYALLDDVQSRRVTL